VKSILLGMTLFLLIAAPSSADIATDLTSENAELKQRVDKLEKELAEIKGMLKQQMDAARAAAPAPADESRLSQADVEKILEAVRKETGHRKPLWSNLDIQLYGYLKADASYDDSRTNTGNFVLYVDNETGKNNDDEFNLTANQSRFGLRIRGPEDETMRTSGQVEIDFYGGGAENKPNPMMRHAFMTLEWPDEKFSILAGQTSDIFSPLYPDTLNYTVLWDAGNIGYRRPQIRLTKGIDLSNDVTMKLEGGIARTIGDDELITTSGGKSGEDSGFPTFQGRVGFTFPWLAYKPTTVGFSGHWGEEEYDRLTTTTTSEKFDSWSLNFDILQPINELLSIKGEAFCGKNLDAYFGGIGQGVRATTAAGITTYHNEIGSRGGWIAASITPVGKWNFNLGIGIDDVENADINAGQRALNRSIFGNAIYSINENTKFGVELSQWRTEYKGSGDADDIRAQTSFIYSF